jgi:hypothetical protein
MVFFMTRALCGSPLERGADVDDVDQPVVDELSDAEPTKLADVTETLGASSTFAFSAAMSSRP